MRFFRFPKWLRRFYPGAVFELPEQDKKVIYLTFDDGPTPGVTPWVLDVLEKYQARATFFCLGKNVAANQSLYADIIARGHAIGNHGMHHLKGLRTSLPEYLADVREAANHIHSPLFRPAYGKLSRAQFRAIKAMHYTVVLWSVMPYDFDAGLAPEKRLRAVQRLLKPGAIIVLHDSNKAYPQLRDHLPALLEYLRSEGFEMCALPQNN